MLEPDRPRGQLGQTAAELLGVLLLVAVIGGFLVQSQWGDKLGQDIKEQICKIAGDPCPAAEGDYDAGLPPLSECVRQSSERGLEGEVKVTFITVGGELKGTKEVRADGSVRISFEANADLGVEFATPGADAEGGGAKGGEKAEIEVEASGGGKYSWDFDSAEDADKFVHNVEKKVLAILDPTPNFPGTSDDADIELPDPTLQTYQGGIGVNASASAGVAGLDGAISGKGGVTYNNEDGSKTVFLQVKGNVGGNVGPLGGSFGGSAQLAVTYDKDGNEQSVRFIGTADVTSSFDVGKDQGFKDILKEATDDAAKLKASGGVGNRGIFDAKLDLTDPANKAAWDAFVNGANPLTGSPVDAGQGAAQLLDRFDEDAVMNTKLYSLSKSKTGGGFDGTVVGAEAYYNTEDADLINAWYRDKGTGDWTQWEQCVRGGG